jgi:hypothetical protein
MIARGGTADRDWSDLVSDLGKALGYLHRTMDHRGDLPKKVS